MEPASAKQIEKGERHMRAEHLRSFCRIEEGNLIEYRGTVQASMKQKVYNVKVS